MHTLLHKAILRCKIVSMIDDIDHNNKKIVDHNNNN